jgi:uncharacterized membrane protein (DUF4010 family)
MYLRMVALIAFVSPSFVPELWWRFCLMCVAGLVIAWLVRPSSGKGSHTDVTTLQNPFEVIPALIFAALFIVFTIVTALVRTQFGDAGLITVSALIGLADITPVALSLANTPTADSLLVAAILVAMMTNTLAKGVYFSSLVGSVRRTTLIYFSIWAALHLPLIFLG